MSCKYVVNCITNYLTDNKKILTSNIFANREDASNFILQDVQATISEAKLTDGYDIHCKQNLTDDLPNAIVTVKDNKFTWQTTKVETKDCTDLPVNRLVYLTNRLIDNMLATMDEKDVIAKLLDLGFTQDEIAYEFDLTDEN